MMSRLVLFALSAIMYISIAAPLIFLLLDAIHIAGIIDRPDPGLVKRMRPF